MQNTSIEGFRLSPQQRHLWQLQQGGYEPAYRVQGTIVIEGDIKQDVLKSALENVIHRYEILNTTFHQLPGLSIPVQVINEPNGLLLREHNISELESQEQHTQIETLLREENGSPFELDRGPLLKITQVILAPNKQLLHVSLPALCADATTLGNLVREIGQTYAQLRGGQTTAGEEIMQYADISEWQNELLESEEGESGKAYWRKQNIAEFLDFRLPFEKSLSGNEKFAPESLSLELDADLFSKIQEHAGISCSAFLLTCWQVLLWRLTGQSNLVVGVGCDGRTYEELQGTLGLLAKYLPVSSPIENNLQFTEVLQQVNKSLDEHLEWQEYFSWEDIVGPEGGVKFFPVCFTYEEFPKIALADVSFSLVQQYAYIDRFDIKLACIQRDDSLTTEFHYDAHAFQTEDIARLSEQFQVLLKSILDRPDTTVADFEILTEDERKQILGDFNDTANDFPADKCIHHLIDERAERTPDSAAVVFENETLSYSELNKRANQLAHYLQKAGVVPETPVAIYIEPSLEMMVGLLGILKSGGAYVPLDPEYPTDRLDAILEDTQAPVVLTQGRLQSAIPKNRARLIALDSDWETIAAESDATPESDVASGNLAYIIFTSGSTGKPKGVPISHQNLVHSTFARLVYYKEPVGRFLLLSSFSFDSSMVGLFWSLCSGGTLVLPEAGLQRDPQPVADLIAEQGITHMLCLPSLYSLLLSEIEPRKLSSLDTVIVAGEACTKNVVERHNELFPQTGLFNEYGPTEGTVWCTVFDCRSRELETQVPIGRPIPNSQIYLLNDNMRPVPIGVAGEIYIGGLGLTRGYLNRPELTADILVPNPFAEEMGARLYKTGDLARYLPDGNIEFLGRADQQVKIRGYRIELGEVEAVLNQHSFVTQSVVVVSETSQQETSDKRLVAYIVPEQNQQPKITELRSFIKEQLPDFMAPSAFVFLESLPLTPNGKVDRNALPQPDQTRPDLEAAFIPPRNAIEEVLCGIWEEVLNIEKVGIHDNFFDLGGHSILVTRLVSRIRDSLQVELPLRTVFETPTVAALSDALVKDPEKKSKVEKTAELLVKLAELSDEEAEAMLDSRA